MAAYEKKSWGKWVLIYLIVGGIIYGLIYYFWGMGRGGATLY